ncbi:Sorting nexin MVP1 [Wickerhamomyces ciferrii]|uniref:Endosomal/vacuolar adapter protein YPT35 n=1 Tax=Wickerhamomyces ciferrii (strain ATCC 14091 / BCRC 22168 / CBS 111 / JCM 3599 / NBRC 0793 / NRRL Y-1031 F-60-10) TaxID=1206466 RepID=K0KXX9_WICCF|nr:Sorting nexin MVP1 [Wickerhamomyces ciferrii]CCH46294.1 Sorting nexin MVP1 [Wickerhamomyces ciferrii]
MSQEEGRKKQKIRYLPPVPIQMVDNESDDEEVNNNTQETTENHSVSNSQNNNDSHNHSNITVNRNSIKTWAKDVRIGDCTIVSGQGAGQKFAVWSITIETTSKGQIHLLKRYSEFDSLRNILKIEFPKNNTEIPKLPPKKAFGNLNNDFLVKRRRGLEYFLSCILLNPVLANSETVKRFASGSTK